MKIYMITPRVDENDTGISIQICRVEIQNRILSVHSIEYTKSALGAFASSFLVY